MVLFLIFVFVFVRKTYQTQRYQQNYNNKKTAPCS